MRKVVLTGFCRSGTTSITAFFKAFGVPAHHQLLGPAERLMKPYPLLHPPRDAAAYIARKAEALRGSEGFEASWGFAHYMYGLSNAAPKVDWLVMVRDPEEACNSLKAYNRKGAPIGELAALYVETCESLLRQARLMVRPPRLLRFERYVSGEYNRALLDLFDIPQTDENLMAAAHHLQKKIRSSGDYTLHPCAEGFARGYALLEKLCVGLPELGKENKG